MYNLISLCSLKLNWNVGKVHLDNYCSFLKNIKCFSDNLHSSPTGEKKKICGHCIYAICLTQERLVLKDVLKIQSKQNPI